MPSLTTNGLFRKLDHSSLTTLSTFNEKIRAYKLASLDEEVTALALEAIKNSVVAKGYVCVFSLELHEFQKLVSECHYLVRIGKVLALCHQIENLDLINPPEDLYDHITGSIIENPVRCHMGHIFSNIDVCRAFISDKNRCLYCEHDLTLDQLTPVEDLAIRVSNWKQHVFSFSLAKYTNQQLCLSNAMQRAHSEESDTLERAKLILTQIQMPSVQQKGRFEEILMEASEYVGKIRDFNKQGSQYAKLSFHKPIKILTWSDYEKIEGLAYKEAKPLIDEKINELKEVNKIDMEENYRQYSFIISQLTDNPNQMRLVESRAQKMISDLKEELRILEEIKNEYQRKRVEASKRYNLDQQELALKDFSLDFDKFRIGIESQVSQHITTVNKQFLEARSNWHEGSVLIKNIEDIIDGLKKQIEQFEYLYESYELEDSSSPIAPIIKTKLKKITQHPPKDTIYIFLNPGHTLLAWYAHFKDRLTEFSDRIDSLNIRLSKLFTSTSLRSQDNSFQSNIEEIEKRLKDFNDYKSSLREKLIEALNVGEVHSPVYHKELVSDVKENRKTAVSIDKALQELDKSLSFQESLLSIQNYFRGFVHQLTIGFISPPKLSTPVDVSLGNNIENGSEEETKKQIITRIDLDIKSNKMVEEANKANLLFWGNIFTSVAAVKYPLLIGILGVKDLGLLCLSYKLANDRYKRALETLGLNEVERSEDIVEAYLSKSKEMHGGFDQDSSQEYGKYELAAAAMYLHTYKKIPFNLTKSRELQVFSTIYIPYQDTITGDSKSLRAISYDAISVGASLATRCAVNNFSNLKASTSASPKLLKK